MGIYDEDPSDDGAYGSDGPAAERMRGVRAARRRRRMSARALVALVLVVAIFAGAVAGTVYAILRNAGYFDPGWALIEASADTRTVDPEEYSSDGYRAVAEASGSFAAAFAPAAYENFEGDGNMAVSPVSVFSGLALAAQCSSGTTRSEILGALGLGYPSLLSGFDTLCNSLARETLDPEGRTVTKASLADSLWLQTGQAVSVSCLDTLSEAFRCDSYQADFASSNKKANRAVRNYVKERTYGLIDRDFRLPEDTLLAVVSAFCLQDVWDAARPDGLPLTDETYGFTQGDGTVADLRLLEGEYAEGRAAEFGEFSSFFARTSGGYEIRFIVPSEGYSVDEVFTEENVAAAASAGYERVDDEAAVRYNTRCLFPEFEAGYDGDVTGILEDAFGIRSLFSEGCDLSALTNSGARCSGAQHAAALSVTRKGIEGASVTAETAGVAGEPDWYTDVYLDFVVDRAFGFVVTDSRGITLFSGVVNQV